MSCPRLLILLSISILAIISCVGGTQPRPEPPGSVDPISRTPAQSRPAVVGDGDLPFEIDLPAGFKITLYAGNIPNARSMTMSPSGTLFVGTTTAGNLYALLDNDRDYRADEGHLIGRRMNMPNGVAFRDGSLYVAEANRILRYDDIENRLENPPAPVIINDDFPNQRTHGWKLVRFGPDGMLYVPVGAPCNVCEPPAEIFGTIMRMQVAWFRSRNVRFGRSQLGRLRLAPTDSRIVVH